jgi:small subunit ribosomal protein S20
MVRRGCEEYQEICVAHTLSARKRVRQTAKRRDRNRDRKRDIRLELKKMQTVIAGGDKAAAAAELKKAQHVLDRIANRGSIHPNTAARRKSKLAKKLNAIAAAK